MRRRFGELRDGGVRFCPDCKIHTLEDEMHFCPGKKEEGKMGEVAVVFNGGDIISMGDLQEYQGVIMKAFGIHLDRDRIRKGLWKEYPAKDQFDVIKIKVDRILRSIEHIAGLEVQLNVNDELIAELKENIRQESYDIINYAVFGVRQL